jgi:hypothetical protein
MDKYRYGTGVPEDEGAAILVGESFEPLGGQVLDNVQEGPVHHQL